MRSTKNTLLAVPNVIDPYSGYSASLPVTQQGYPYWWLYEPDKYESIKRLRHQHGITITDELKGQPSSAEELLSLRASSSPKGGKRQATAKRRVKVSEKGAQEPCGCACCDRHYCNCDDYPDEFKCHCVFCGGTKSDAESRLHRVEFAGVEFKIVRHVRTPAGVRRFNQPLGSVIVRDGESPLGGLQAMPNDFHGWEKLHGTDGNDYYVGKDPEDPKVWVATDANDNVITEAASEEAVYEALNKHVTGGTKPSRGRTPQPASKGKHSSADLPKNPKGGNWDLDKPIGDYEVYAYRGNKSPFDNGHDWVALNKVTGEYETFSTRRDARAHAEAGKKGSHNVKPAYVPTPGQYDHHRDSLKKMLESDEQNVLADRFVDAMNKGANRASVRIAAENLRRNIIREGAKKGAVEKINAMVNEFEGITVTKVSARERAHILAKRGADGGAPRRVTQTASGINLRTHDGIDYEKNNSDGKWRRRGSKNPVADDLAAILERRSKEPPTYIPPSTEKAKPNYKKVRSEYPGFKKYQGEDGNAYYLQYDDTNREYVIYDANDNELAATITESDALDAMHKMIDRKKTEEEMKKKRDTDGTSLRTALDGHKAMMRQYETAYGTDRSTWPQSAQDNVASLENRITSLGGTVPTYVAPKPKASVDTPGVGDIPPYPKFDDAGEVGDWRAQLAYLNEKLIPKAEAAFADVSARREKHGSKYGNQINVDWQKAKDELEGLRLSKRTYEAWLAEHAKRQSAPKPRVSAPREVSKPEEPAKRSTVKNAVSWLMADNTPNPFSNTIAQIDDRNRKIRQWVLTANDDEMRELKKELQRMSRLKGQPRSSAMAKVALRRIEQMRAAETEKSLRTMVIESKSLMERLDYVQVKVVRHVRTPAGKHRFGQPIGSIIVRDGSPPLPNIRAVDNDYDGWEKLQGEDGVTYYTTKDPSTNTFVATDESGVVLLEHANETTLYRNLDKMVGDKTTGTKRKLKRKSVPGQKAAAREGAKWDGDVLVTHDGYRVECPPGFKIATDEEWKEDGAPPGSQMYYKFVGPGKFSGLGKRIPKTAFNEKNPWQNHYEPAHHAKRSVDKFQQIKVLMKRMPQLDKALRDADLNEDDTAAVVYLMRTTGMRVGNEDSAAGEGVVNKGEPSYGATTLLNSHVKVTPAGTITFSFKGKKAIDQVLIVKGDKRMADMIRARQAALGRNDPLFGETDPKQTIAFIRSATKLPTAKNHHLRAIKATSMALALVKKKGGALPKTDREFKQWQKEVCEVVAAQLGNTWTMARGSYISPSVWDQWRIDAMKVRRK